MIKEIQIENFKSIQSLNLELGRLNVFIGANGSGKSNILEAITFGAAAAAHKLDNEFLGTRGIRATEAEYFKSGFGNVQKSNTFDIKFTSYEDEHIKYLFHHEKHGKNWEVTTEGDLAETNIEKSKTNFDTYIKLLYKSYAHKLSEADFEKASLRFIADLIVSEFNDKSKISDFMIFAPENHFLRRFEEETQIKPLGIRGEGFFSHLVQIFAEKPEKFEEIKQHLNLIDWFEDLNISLESIFTNQQLHFTDTFLGKGLKHFDQRSVNEGTLYLLFYLTLFISDETPKFFAIDNIDNAMNPKLGSELVNLLSKLAKAHDKQVILTTHNPSVLDGLELSDDDQRLFVVSRNKSGHTKVLRVPYRETDERLSARFIRGSIGGLPKNF